MHASLDWSAAFAARTRRMGASEIRELLKLVDQPDVISFAGGLLDPALFPAQDIQAAYDEVLSDPLVARQALQYSSSEGYEPLRRWIAGHMATLGVPCGPDNVVITSGSQQALDFLGKLLLSPGDTALVEAPTYLGAVQAFNAYEPHYDHLSPEGGNRTPATYADGAARRGGRVRFAYAVPDFANPTGRTLSRPARERLLSLAADLGVPVIEDGAYAALRYDGAPQPALIALDVARTGSIDASRVIYCGTFSKTLSPALRIGWVCAARPLVEKVVLAKQAGDLHVATINQIVAHRILEAGYAAQIARVRAAYRRRRDRMLAALARTMPVGVSWERPEGGMFVWVTLPPRVDGAELLARAVEAGVAFVPGGAFYADQPCRHTIRLSYSIASDAGIDEGVARLAHLIAAPARLSAA